MNNCELHGRDAPGLELDLDWDDDEEPTQRRSYSKLELELSKIAEELPPRDGG